MAGQTVIDQLIVKLGLDPRDFDKGTKQAAASVLGAEDKVRKSTDGMGRNITSLAGKWLTATAIIAGLRKSVSIIDDVAERTRRLGIDSKNYGQAAAELRNFENAVEDAGGSAEDARKTIGNFNKAIFDLAYNGQVSDSLVMLGRLGVQFQDSAGQARNFKDVVLDTADAIGKAQQQGMDRASAFQFLQQSGFDAGTAELILQGRGAVEAGLAQQEKRRQVTADDVQKATNIRRASIGKDQALEGAKIEGMQFAGGVQEEVNKFIEKLASPGGVNQALEDLGDQASKLADKFGDFVAGKINSTRPKGRAAYESVIQSAAAKNGIPPEILAGVLATESNFDPTAVNQRSGARGIAQLMPKYYPDAGKNPDDDIRTAARVLAENLKLSNDNWDVALQMYNAGPTRVRNAMEGKGGPLAQETVDYPGKVLDYATQPMPTPNAQASGAGSKTDVQIDSITVQTQATDAQGIARDLDSEVQRKLLVSHAEQGVQ